MNSTFSITKEMHTLAEKDPERSRLLNSNLCVIINSLTWATKKILYILGGILYQYGFAANVEKRNTGE